MLNLSQRKVISTNYHHNVCQLETHWHLVFGFLNNPTEYKPRVFVLRPETQAYIQKIEEEKAAKQKGDTQDNRSFFAKYVSTIITTGE